MGIPFVPIGSLSLPSPKPYQRIINIIEYIHALVSTKSRNDHRNNLNKLIASFKDDHDVMTNVFYNIDMAKIDEDTAELLINETNHDVYIHRRQFVERCHHRWKHNWSIRSAYLKYYP